MAEVIIDEVIVDKEKNVVLRLRQPEPWSDLSVVESFRNRVNGYLETIKSGVLFEKYPEVKNSPIKIEVIIYHAVPEELLLATDEVNARIQSKNIQIKFMHIVVGNAPVNERGVLAHRKTFFQRLFG